MQVSPKGLLKETPIVLPYANGFKKKGIPL
jgi:hypothetical protein